MNAAQKKRSLGACPLLYPEPALLVGAYDQDGKPNVMTAAWAGICNSDPVSLMVAIRPERWTHDAIITRKAFTVGVATESMVRAVDYLGMASGRRYDKLAVAGLTAVRAEKVDAPYLAECPVILECTLTSTLLLGSHTVMIGAIQDVKADEDCLNENGLPDLARFSPLIYDAGTRRYFGVGGFVADGFSAGKALLKQGEK